MERAQADLAPAIAAERASTLSAGQGFDAARGPPATINSRNRPQQKDGETVVDPVQKLDKCCAGRDGVVSATRTPTPAAKMNSTIR